MENLGMSKMFYKYRGITNLERTLDVIVEKRLYAAQFTDLNDPMEGIYLYDDQVLTPFERGMITKEKLEYRLVSLSETHASTLMWSYYAEGHTGVVITVDLLGNSPGTLPIQYIGPRRIDGGNSVDARGILCRKYKLWEHEREHRIFTHKDNLYVDVDVKEIIFGLSTPNSVKKIVEAVAVKFCPTATWRDLRREELEGLEVTDV